MKKVLAKFKIETLEQITVFGAMLGCFWIAPADHRAGILGASILIALPLMLARYVRNLLAKTRENSQLNGADDEVVNLFGFGL